MGRWRQPLSVKAQATLSLSLPGREDHKEREKHTRKNNMEAQCLHTKPQIKSYRDPFLTLIQTVKIKSVSGVKRMNRGV